MKYVIAAALALLGAPSFAACTAPTGAFAGVITAEDYTTGSPKTIYTIETITARMVFTSTSVSISGFISKFGSTSWTAIPATTGTVTFNATSCFINISAAGTSFRGYVTNNGTAIQLGELSGPGNMASSGTLHKI